MTTFEHAMFGGTLALAVGCRRHGWALVAAAAVAATLPDWDSLSLAFGGRAYSEVHRVWGHNLLVAGSTGALAGGLGYLCYLSTRVRRTTVRFWPKSNAADPVPPFRTGTLVLWIFMGLAAALSHLPADVVVSGRAGMMSWPVRWLWPFSERGSVWPLVAWGDLTITLIFIGEMFALYRWPAWTQSLAVLTLFAVHGYVGVCWLTGGVAP